jgi:hypothetical protein
MRFWFEEGVDFEHRLARPALPMVDSRVGLAG